MLYPNQLEKVMPWVSTQLVHRETIWIFNAEHTAFYKEVSSVIRITHTSRYTRQFNNKTKKCIIIELKTFETPGFSHYTNEVRCSSTYNQP